MALKRRVKDALKKQLAHVFHFGQRLGVDILPRHFYSEVPDMRKLRAGDQWRTPFSLIDVRGSDVDVQLQFVRSIVTPDVRESLTRQDLYPAACAANGAIGYGPIESEFLYAFVRQHRPRKILQIGSGVSTHICLTAARDEGHDISITCIDPYPTSYLIAQQRAGSIQLVPSPVEELDISFLSDLMAGDFFFVDSTHTLGPAGEVSRIILEMLPRLAAGIIVHFHDVWFPYDFDPRIMDRVFFWHETPLLLAFLCGNPRFRILASLSMLHHERQNELRQLFPRYDPMQIECGVRVRHGHYPNAIYLDVTNDAIASDSV